MALIEIDMNEDGEYLDPIFDANNTQYGRVDETYLRIVSTQGARPRVLGSRYRRSVDQIHWDVQVPQPSRIRLPSHSEYTVHELKARGSYQVVLYPIRRSLYLHVQHQGQGSLLRAEAFTSDSFVNAESFARSQASNPRTEMFGFVSPLTPGVARAVPPSVTRNRYEAAGQSWMPDSIVRSFPDQDLLDMLEEPAVHKQPPMKAKGPTNRFDRILNEHDEWDDKFKIWKTNQPIEDALAQQMNALEAEEAELRLQAKRNKIASALKTPQVSEAELDEILASVLKGK